MGCHRSTWVFDFSGAGLSPFILFLFVLFFKKNSLAVMDFISTSSYCCVEYTEGCCVAGQWSCRSNRCAGLFSSMLDRLGQTRKLLSLAGPVAHGDIEKSPSAPR